MPSGTRSTTDEHLSTSCEKRLRAIRLSDDRLTEYDEEALRQFETEVDEP